MRIIDVLHDLQTIDSQLDAARLALADAQRLIGDRSALEPLTRDLTHAREELHRLEAEQRDLELDAESKRAKIAADENKLYSGRVTNPKELEAISEEVRQEKQQLGVVEDRLLELLDAGETLGSQIADLERDLARATDAWGQAQTRAQSRAQELQQSIDDLESERGALLGQVEAPTRLTYENLRKQKGGMAIATVLQRTCQACRVSSLTPAMEQRARIGAELITCPSCGRILYVSLN